MQEFSHKSFLQVNLNFFILIKNLNLWRIFLLIRLYMSDLNKDKSFWKKSLFESFSDTTWEDVMCYGTTMFYVHCFIFWLAIFFSFKCNNGFDLPDFFMAVSCSPCYIAYKLGT